MALAKNAEDGCAAEYAMTRCKELGDFDSSNLIFVSQKIFLIIDLRSTLDVLKAADIQSTGRNVENILVKSEQPSASIRRTHGS